MYSKDSSHSSHLIACCSLFRPCPYLIPAALQTWHIWPAPWNLFYLLVAFLLLWPTTILDNGICRRNFVLLKSNLSKYPSNIQHGHGNLDSLKRVSNCHFNTPCKWTKYKYKNTNTKHEYKIQNTNTKYKYKNTNTKKKQKYKVQKGL